MNYWTFKVFISHRGENVIEAWLNSLCDGAHNKIDLRIKHLKTQKVLKRPYFSDYKGYDKIKEVRIIYNNIQYRILGCFGPGDKEVTLLIGTEEKGNRLIDKNAPQIAVKRRQLIYNDRRYTDDYE